jgi:excisionase family DNA binding protein
MPVTTIPAADGGGFRSYRWVSVPRAGQILGVPHEQVYLLIDKGHLPGYQIGGEIKLLADDVEELRDRFRGRKGD